MACPAPRKHHGEVREASVHAAWSTLPCLLAIRDTRPRPHSSWDTRLGFRFRRGTSADGDLGVLGHVDDLVLARLVFRVLVVHPDRTRLRHELRGGSACQVEAKAQECSNPPDVVTRNKRSQGRMLNSTWSLIKFIPIFALLVPPPGSSASTVLHMVVRKSGGVNLTKPVQGCMVVTGRSA